MKHLFLIFCFLLAPILMPANDLPFQAGEELRFDIHYKYGLVMVRAGSANFKIEENSNKKNLYCSILSFKTTSFFDRIFKMRDTLRSCITEDLHPLYHSRSVHEGNYQFTEEMFFNKFTPEQTEVRVKRVSQQQLKFDTILTSNMMTFDMLNLLLFVRTFDYSKMESAPVRKISTFVGRDKIAVIAHCEGQSIFEKSETIKYKTYKIAFDFTDSAFNESKNAVEVWISDDKNRIPLKIRAKLRIGAAEVYLTSWKNLKYPLSSEIVIPVQKDTE